MGHVPKLRKVSLFQSFRTPISQPRAALRLPWADLSGPFGASSGTAKSRQEGRALLPSRGEPDWSFREASVWWQLAHCGNRSLDFKYRLIVENYKEEPALVRVYDRLPFSEDTAAIRVTLAEMKDPLDQNPLYLRRQRPKGILRWEITVAAASVREKVRTIEYSFSIEFDRTFQLGTLAGKQEQSEFENLKRFRAAPAALPIAPKAGPAPTAPVPGPAP